MFVATSGSNSFCLLWKAVSVPLFPFCRKRSTNVSRTFCTLLTYVLRKFSRTFTDYRDGKPRNSAEKFKFLTTCTVYHGIEITYMSHIIILYYLSDHTQKYTNYTPLTVAATECVSNYSCSLLSMGLLARNFKDSWKEGDVSRSIRLWEYLLLHFKQSGHTKYAYEAFQLLAGINVTLTPKHSYELMWNRVCSNRNGAGHNIY